MIVRRISLLIDGLPVCEEKREICRGKLDVVSKRLTCQEWEADDELFVYRSKPEAYHPEYWNPTQSYTLRGVAVTSELAFVCTREEPSADGGIKDQWWQIDCASSNGLAPKVEVSSLSPAYGRTVIDKEPANDTAFRSGGSRLWV